MDPFQAPITSIVNFLRSAISSYYGLVESKKVGEHLILIRLLKGVFNMRPPTQSLAPSWYLSRVLARLCEPPPFEPMLEVPLKWVSLKTVFLFEVASASKSSDITKAGLYDDACAVRAQSDRCQIVPRSLRKQARPGHLFEDIVYTSF